MESNKELPFKQGDWITASDKFSSLGNVQLFENPFRLEHDPYQIENEYRIKARVRLGPTAFKEKELTLDYFRKTMNPAMASAEQRLRHEMTKAPTPATDVAVHDEVIAAQVEAKFEELKNLITNFIQDDEMKKQMADKVDTILRLIQFREVQQAQLEDRLGRVEAEISDLVRNKNLAFSGAVTDKTQ